MRWLRAVVWLVCVVAGVRADPADAVVRQPSHGCSCTVIWTGPGKSLLLGCGHAYESAADRVRPIVLDLPAPLGLPQPVPGARPKLVRLDFAPNDEARDLSLIEIPVGPLPYVCPVAPAGHRPGRTYTAGYPEMKPRSVLPAQIAPYPFGDGDDGKTTWTFHLPREGRSGGALIDYDRGVLVGVTQGYTVQPPRRGMYVSLAVVRRFLGMDTAPAYQYRPPVTYPYRPPADPFSNQNAAPGACPGGH
jgi:hypothetical protein